jgi:hypothetical protein
VLVPCGAEQQQQRQQEQQQQQQQQEEEEDGEEEGLPPAGVDMPGDWRVVSSTTGTLTSNSRQDVKLYSTSLVQQLLPLAADHFLLRAHYGRVGHMSDARCNLSVACNSHQHSHQHRRSVAVCLAQVWLHLCMACSDQQY